MPTPLRRPRAVACALAFSLALGAPALPAQDARAPEASDVAAPAPFVETIPGTTVTLEFVPLALPDGEGTRTLWFARTETTWDAFDVLVFRLDEEAGVPGSPEVDALARPSKPFVLADRGYGHAGYPAISISHRAAATFAAWLSARTGGRYRLPTEAEFDAACALDAPPSETKDALDAVAWTRENATRKTHAVDSKARGRAGLADLLGNVAEWCDAADGPPVLKGGAFTDKRGALGCAARVPDDPSLNQTDPQIPKSPWWLADGPFAGFRLVAERAPASPRGDDVPSDPTETGPGATTDGDAH